MGRVKVERRLFQMVGQDLAWDLIDLGQWRKANPGPENRHYFMAIARLQPGQTYTGGGGAFAEFQIRCVGRYSP